MKRIKHITISTVATVAVAAAVAAPVSAYESVNATLNPAAGSADHISSGTSVNAALAESTPVAAKGLAASSPNAILGSRNVGEPVVQTSVSSTGFDWSDALIGAGSALAIVLLAGGAMVLARRRMTVQPTV